MLPHLKVDDTNIDKDEGEEYDGMTKHYIPTTVEGGKPIQIISDRNRISKHAVLNMQGSILTRSQKKLVLNSYEKHFLERVLATKETKSVPLVYAKAMQYPGIFCNSVQDHTMVGAIPTCFMTTRKTCNAYNIASIERYCKH